MKRLIGLVCCLVLLNLGTTHVEAQVRIAWLSPMQTDYTDVSPFWPLSYKFMAAAVEDLDLELKIYFSGRDHLLMTEHAQQIASGKEGRFDAVMFYDLKQRGLKILHILNEAGVPAFSFNSDLSIHPNLGQPRQKYPYWIGQMSPDDQYAGELLLRKLVEEYHQYQGESPTEIVAIQGAVGHPANINRKRGFERALKDFPQHTFLEYVNGEWGREQVQTMFSKIWFRYEAAKIFWVANDGMALGLYDAMVQEEIQSGTEIIYGGVDWAEEAIQLIKEGKMNVSIGGHFLEGAFTLVLLHDYAKGVDFAELGDTVFKTKMLSLTKNNINEFGDLEKKMELQNIHKQLDFKNYSRFYNPTLKQYPFSIQGVLKQL